MLSEKGLLGDTPVIRLLLAIFERRLTGILYLKRNETLKVLYFNRGKFTWAISNAPEDRLETLLIDRKLIDGDTVELFRKSVKAPESLGKTLVENGLITLENLVAMTREQLERIVASVLEWTSGGYQFVSDTPPERLVSLDLEIPILVHHCVQEHLEMDTIWKEIGTLQLPLQLTSDSARLAAYPLSEYQKQIIAAFRNPTPLEAVLPRFADSPRQSALKSVYFLMVAGLLTRADAAPPRPAEGPAEATAEPEPPFAADSEPPLPTEPPLPEESTDRSFSRDAVRAAAQAAGWREPPADGPGPDAGREEEEAPAPVSIDLPDSVGDAEEEALVERELPALRLPGAEDEAPLVSPASPPGEPDDEDFLAAEIRREKPAPTGRSRPADLPRPFVSTMNDQKHHRLVYWTVTLAVVLFVVGGLYLLLIRSHAEPPAVGASEPQHPVPVAAAAAKTTPAEPRALPPETAARTDTAGPSAESRPGPASPRPTQPVPSPAPPDPRTKPAGADLSTGAWSQFRSGNLITAADIWREELKRGQTAFSILIELDCQKESVAHAFRQFDRGQQRDFFLLNRRRDNRTCWLVFWGRFRDRAEAERQLARVPAVFFRQPEPPAVYDLVPYL